MIRIRMVPLGIPVYASAVCLAKVKSRDAMIASHETALKYALSGLKRLRTMMSIQIFNQSSRNVIPFACSRVTEKPSHVSRNGIACNMIENTKTILGMIIRSIILQT